MPEHLFKSPIRPGDPLWWASDTARAGLGPVLVQAREAENSVEAVLFSEDGMFVITDGGTQESIGDRYSCLDESSCLEWIKCNMSDATLLDGRTIKAVHSKCDGSKEIVDLECTIHAIENLFGSSGLASGDRDDMGHFPIYRENAHQDNSSVTTFVRDRAGNPISAIHGEYLLVRSIFDEKTGMSVLVDPTPEVLDAVAGISGKPDKNSCQ